MEREREREREGERERGREEHGEENDCCNCHHAATCALKKGKDWVFEFTKVKLVKATQLIYIQFVNMVLSLTLKL